MDQAKQPVPVLSPVADAVLAVRNLAARYGPLDVLRNVSFDVKAGRCTAVVGQSGSGKTTLARSLVGLHTDWTGDVELSGTKLSSDPQRRSKEHRRTLQYVFQNPYGSLDPRMTVRQNLEEPLRHFFGLSRSERDRKVNELMVPYLYVIGQLPQNTPLSMVAVVGASLALALVFGLRAMRAPEEASHLAPMARLRPGIARRP